MMVSTAMAVLPVPRSPMISSRCPRPMGIIESMALMPVCRRLLHRLPADDARSLELHRTELGGLDGALAVERHPERVDHAADQRLTHRHLDDLAGALDLVALFDERVFAHEHGADAVFFEVEHQAHDAVRQLEHLGGYRVLQPLDAGHTVADLHDGAHLLDVDARLVALDAGFKDAGYLLRTQLQLNPPS